MKDKQNVLGIKSAKVQSGEIARELARVEKEKSKKLHEKIGKTRAYGVSQEAIDKFILEELREACAQ